MPHPDSAATAAASGSWRAAVVAVALLLLPVAAQAQQPQRQNAATVADTTVYTFVEEMPELPGGGGNAAIVALIQKRIRIPPLCGQLPERSRVLFAFTVTETGAVRDIRILQSIDSRVDTAIVQAIRALPRFKPGRHHQRPVRVKYTMPISFHWQ